MDYGWTEIFTEGGNDEFNSVEWFTDLAKDSKSLKRIQFALYPWKDLPTYQLEKSNMVAWIKDWEVEWDKILLRRRRGKKGEHSWFLTEAPPNKPLAWP